MPVERHLEEPAAQVLSDRVCKNALELLRVFSGRSTNDLVVSRFEKPSPQ
jgi:hypothetical protein